jgi:hypothetical protein
MVDPADALQDPITGRAERAQIERDWIISSAECGRRAREALTKAAEVLAEAIPGRRPDAELLRPGLRWARDGPLFHTPRRSVALRLVPSR